MSADQKGNGGSTCGCPATDTLVEIVKEASLEDLIPIAVVIAAGCESCTEKMVTRALEEGSSRRDIQKTLGIVASMQKLDCLAEAVSEDVVARMDKPLAAGRKTLQQALARGRC